MCYGGYSKPRLINLKRAPCKLVVVVVSVVVGTEIRMGGKGPGFPQGTGEDSYLISDPFRTAVTDCLPSFFQRRFLPLG